MMPLAHAGHWIANLLYLVPVAAMVAALIWAKMRDPGDEEQDSVFEGGEEGETRPRDGRSA